MKDNTKKNKKYGPKARDIIVRQFIKMYREEAIRADIEIKMMESLENKLNEKEKKVLFGGVNPMEQRLEELKAYKSAAIIRLETLKEMRDGKPKLDNKENREFLTKAPEAISVETKK